MARRKSKGTAEDEPQVHRSSEVADRFDTNLCALIREAEDRFGKTGNEDWADVTVRLERVRSIIRDMMTPKARARIK